ncbi:hypothetical protein SESBI_03136 [Sesbania bispinosa]|nr:hypothetical protein SESBI_03136 [Sesbania bispinosa]
MLAAFTFGEDANNSHDKKGGYVNGDGGIASNNVAIEGRGKVVGRALEALMQL